MIDGDGADAQVRDLELFIRANGHELHDARVFVAEVMKGRVDRAVEDVAFE